MYMSIHTQEEMTTFADTECSSMRAYFHHLQSLFQLISFSASRAITAVPKHPFFSPLVASFYVIYFPSNSATVTMFIFTFPLGAQIEGIIGALPMVKPMVG